MAEKDPPKPEEILHEDGSIEHPRVKSERQDVRFRWVLAVVAVMVAIGIAQHYLVRMFHRNLDEQQGAAKVSAYPMATGTSSSLPPEPRLEQVDRLAGQTGASAYERGVAEERILSNYGTTSDKDCIRVPIRRAMQQVIADLKFRKEQPEHAEKSDGLLYAGDTTSGRLYQEAPR
jgi:hypothetical protein